MKFNFFQKIILIFISFLTCSVILTGQLEAANNGKVRPVSSKCIFQYKGKCVSESESKGKEVITSAEKLCGNNKVCVVDKQTPGKPVNGNTIAPKKPPENSPIETDGKISDFCKNNPTRAEIQAGNLKSKINSNITYDSSVMSQEECQVWVKGTPKQYQEYVAKNDPEINKEYKSILEDMKEKMTDPELKNNINKAIADIDKTVTSQTKKIESAMSNLLAPARDGALKKIIPIENNPVSTMINTVEKYKNACKKNNSLSADADSVALYPKVVYSGTTRCPAGYIENGLGYSISLGMRCCVKDEGMFSSCPAGQVKYLSECYSRNSSANQYSIVTGSEKWICCPPANTSSISNSNISNPNLIQAPTQSNTIVNTNIIGTDINNPIEYQTLCRLNYPTTYTYTVPGKICNSGYTQGTVGQNGVVGYNSKIGETCCVKIK